MKGYVLVFFGFDITHKKFQDVFIVFIENLELTLKKEYKKPAGDYLKYFWGILGEKNLYML
jgi:hypothetical protein